MIILTTQTNVFYNIVSTLRIGQVLFLVEIIEASGFNQSNRVLPVCIYLQVLLECAPELRQTSVAFDPSQARFNVVRWLTSGSVD